jgi:N-acetyl-gamma-glutamyl-phosphate reductase
VIAVDETRTSTQHVLVYGAGGMLAGELVRLLEAHPVFALAGAVTRTGGEALRGLHPHLASDATCLDHGAALRALATALREESAPAPWLVLALPHGETAALWQGMRSELGPAAARVRVVDLSADYRLQDPQAHARWYGGPHPDPAELASFAYALPELHSVPEGGARLAAPGCFATALQLATVPAAEAGVLDASRPWIFHALTGSSGSGVKPTAGTHHPHRHGNVWSYAHGGHRHEGELAQALAVHGLAPPVTFVPHSGPWVRGIHLSAVLPLAAELGTDRGRALYARRYDAHPFVDVLAEGAPDLRRVVGSDTAAVGVRVQNGALLVELTLDNLIKGGSGQALQAMNLAAGLPETLGLPRTGLGAA